MELPKDITPLIDADWLVHMSCMAVEYGWEEHCQEEGLPAGTPPSMEETVQVLTNTLEKIQDELETKSAPILFFSGDNNFRKEVAKTKEYKGNRSHEKPYHFTNLTSYCEAQYHTRRAGNIEADDLLAVVQTKQLNYKVLGGMHMETIIVTPDKDLRQVDGWHFTLEGHNYPSFGPKYCTPDNSYLDFKDVNKKGKGLIGTGWKFFYSQLITGDTVDNIPGLPGKGPAFAYNILDGIDNEYDAYRAVQYAYRDVCLMADDYLLEQAKLLWMVRKLRPDGSPVMWTPPEVDDGLTNIKK